MANIKRINGKDIKDETARSSITELQNNKSDKTHDHNDLYAVKSAEHTHNNKTVLDGITDRNISNWNSAYAHSQSAHAPSNAEANVQSDWNVSDTNAAAYIKNKPTSLPANGGNADTIDNLHIWTGTQSEYDAISAKDSNTIYLIKE